MAHLFAACKCWLHVVQGFVNNVQNPIGSNNISLQKFSFSPSSLDSDS